jgi:uracil-DNA glycosylase family 4
VSRLVPDAGSPTARLVLIGEAPGTHENARLLPFVGPSGQRLAEWWRTAGLTRTDFYLTNVYPYQPPKNDLKRVAAELPHWIEQLHERLAALDDPWVIVPTGNTALRALTGKSSITKHRGSVYAYRDRRGREIKVIPTIHPAATFRTPSWQRRCRADWTRIAGDAQFRDLQTPTREHLIAPTFDDCLAFLDDADKRAAVLAIDIETPREVTLVDGGVTKTGKVRKPKRVKGQARVTCVGFSFEPHWSLTIPTTLAYWKDADTLAQVWTVIRKLCQLPCEKVLQNGQFDTYYLLLDHGVSLRRYRWDTLGMHHALDATEDHDLAYMASIHTREPYWKDDGKGADGKADAEPSAEGLAQYWRYNGKDACVTRELADVFHGQLVTAGKLAFYDQHYAALFGPLLRSMTHGIAVDAARRKRQFAALTAQCVGWQDRLTEIAGAKLYGTTDLSAKKLTRFLYETLSLPIQRDRKTKKPTTKEVVVRQLMLRYPKVLTEAGTLILDHRRASILSKSYRAAHVDPDGRVRASFNFTPETGRFSSSRNPKRTGRNLQNVDREVREMFVPDAGCLFLECDLSQAEDRIVKVLTKAPRLIERARAMPWENDEHKRAAAVIFHKPVDAITPAERYLGKVTRHATNYDMHGQTHSERLLKDGIVLTADECQVMIDALHQQDPEVKEVFHKQTRIRVLRDRQLTNSWGRTLNLRDERMDDTLYRRAYAFIPQSEVPGIINQWAYIPLHAYIRGRRWRSRIHLQGHDSLLLSVPPEEAWEIASLLHEWLTRPRVYDGVELTIPVEFKLGRTWKGDIEFKRFPEREAFEAAVRTLC